MFYLSLCVFDFLHQSSHKVGAQLVVLGHMQKQFCVLLRCGAV